MGISTLIATALQPIAFLVGALGAWLVVRAPGVNPGAVVRDAGPRARRRSRAILWVILAGLIAAPLRQIARTAFDWIGLLRMPDVLQRIPTISLVISGGTVAGLVVGYLLVWLFYQRIDWTNLHLATGWHPTRAQRLFLFLAFGLFLTWPIAVPLQMVGVARASLDTSQPTAWQGWINIARSVIGHGLGLWAAGTILRRIAGRYDPFTEDAGRLVPAILLIALTSMLAQGVLNLFGLFDQIVQSFAPGPQGAAPIVPNSPVVARLILTALPLLAYLLATPVMRRIDWSRVEDRAGWHPSALDEVLIFLTLAAWLSWPFELPRLITTSVLPAVFPNFTLMLSHVIVAAAALVVLYLVFVYSPGGATTEREEPVEQTVHNP